MCEIGRILHVSDNFHSPLNSQYMQEREEVLGIPAVPWRTEMCRSSLQSDGNSCGIFVMMVLFLLTFIDL